MVTEMAWTKPAPVTVSMRILDASGPIHAPKAIMSLASPAPPPNMA